MGEVFNLDQGRSAIGVENPSHKASAAGCRVYRMFTRNMRGGYQNRIYRTASSGRHWWQPKGSRYERMGFTESLGLVCYCVPGDKTICFFPEWKKFKRVHGEQSERKFFYRLISEIERKGTINVLRNGFKDVGCYFKLFYPKPNTHKNPDLFEKFEKNIFSVIDELEYEQKEKGNRLDLVIFINGLPIITIELKDTFSQGVERAIKQYKEDRDPREKIFQRCFVHFAMSDEKIYMATKLEGWKTRFLPFNKALENPDVKTALSPNPI